MCTSWVRIVCLCCALCAAAGIVSEATAQQYNPPTTPATATPTTPDAQTQAAAPVAPDAKSAPLYVSGHLFSRHEWRDGYSLTPGAPDGSDLIRYRARFGFHTGPWALTESLNMSAHLAPQAAGNWSVGGDTLDNPQLGIQEGYVELQRTMFKIQVGRFEMAYGEHLIIGSVPWHPVGRAFDGVRARFDWGLKDAWVDVFFTSINEGFDSSPAVISPYSGGDVFFTGAYASLGPHVMDKLALDVYALSRIWPASNAPAVPATTPPTTAPAPVDQAGAVEATLGLRSKAELGSVMDYRVEAGVQFGTRRVKASKDAADVFAWQADAELGAKLGDTGLRLALEGLVASGDDPATPEQEGYDQLYPTAHAFLGLMDFVGGRTNVASGVFHAHWKKPWLRVLLDVHAFWRMEVPDGQETYLGSEADLNIVYPIGQNLTLRALYGQFIPESRSSFDDHLHYTELEFNATF